MLEGCHKHSLPELFEGKILLWARVVREGILREVDVELESRHMGK